MSSREGHLPIGTYIGSKGEENGNSDTDSVEKCNLAVSSPGYCASEWYELHCLSGYAVADNFISTKVTRVRALSLDYFRL